MDRYSFLFGATTLANNTNQFSSMGESAGLAPFLQELGANNPSLVTERVREILGGIDTQQMDMLSDYSMHPHLLPLTVRYAPMYLNKLPDMPAQLKSFCAMCVSGFDNRMSGRSGKYIHSHVLSRESILGDGKYTYLDHIFGTHRTTWSEVFDHNDRSKDYFVDCDREPARVEPELDERDLDLVIYAAAALYADLSVIIRVDNRTGFNDRAWNLAMQVYSLLHPKMAAEVGFSIYDKPFRIAALKKDTAVRLFLVSPEYTLEDLAGSADVVMDAASGEIRSEKELPKDLLKAVTYWSKRSWKMRSAVMPALLEQVPLFQEGKPFAEATAAYAQDPFLAWRKAPQEKGSIDSLEALRALYERFPLCQKVPYVHDLFVNMVPRLLKAPATIETLGAEAYARMAYAADAAERKQASQDFDFACRMGLKTTKSATKATGDAVAVKEKEACSVQIRQAEAARDAAIADKDAAVARATAAAAEEVRQTKAAAAEEVAKAKTAAAEEIASEKQRSADALHAARLKAHQELTAEQGKTAQVQSQLDQRTAEYQRAAAMLNQTKAELEQQSAVLVSTNAALDAEKKAHAASQAEVARINGLIAGEQAKAAQAKEQEALARQEADKARKERDEAYATAGDPKKKLFTGGAIGLGIGLVIGLIAVLLVILLGGGGKPASVPETTPTTAPTVPQETTGPAETTVPTETTVPVAYIYAAGIEKTELTVGEAAALTWSVACGGQDVSDQFTAEVQIENTDVLAHDGEGVKAVAEGTVEVAVTITNKTDNTLAETVKISVTVTAPAVTYITQWDQAAMERVTDAGTGAGVLVYDPTNVLVEGYLTDFVAPEGYEVKSLLLKGIPLPGEAKYVLLLQKTAQAAEETTGAAEEPKTMAQVLTEGKYDMMLTVGEFMFIAEGDDETYAAVLAVFSHFAADGQEVFVGMNVGMPVLTVDNVHELVKVHTKDDYWWRSVTAVVTDPVELGNRKSELVAKTPALALTYGENSVLVYNFSSTVQLNDAMTAIGDAAEASAVGNFLVLELPLEQSQETEATAPAVTE